MRAIRRAGGAAAAALLLSALVSGGASAQQQTQTTRPETYLGSAAGRALHLKVAGNEVTLGGTAAFADSTLKASAKGVGSLGLPVVGGDNNTAAEVVGSGQQHVAKTCATPDLPIPNEILGVGVACGSSLAEVLEGGPHALGLGTVAEIDVAAQSLLNTPISTVQDSLIVPVFEGISSSPAQGVLDSLNELLGTDLAVDDTVNELLTALGTTKTLEVRLGESTSEVITEGNKVTSIAKSAAGRIALLPLGAAGLKPVVEIEIGSAQAMSVYDRGTGVSTPSFDPAIVTIRVNTPTTDALSDAVTEPLLGIHTSEIVIGPDLSAINVLPAEVAPIVTACDDAPNEFCILEGTPLETRIAVASGRVVNNPDGTVGAVADAVKIHALRNIGDVVSQLDGGILLELAHAEAGVGGQPAETITIEVPVTRELPRTGGVPWMPLVGGAALLAALTGRRVLARSTR